ncbi:MAG: BREX-4 system phosphatase PglZ [Methanobacteriaceae archaeon]|nr:BREX-4 system phosphatase PglZ [Methanobacteriaceae archaeon]
MGELFETIINDKNSISPLDNRFPVRFIFLNSFVELREIVKFFSEDDLDILELSHLLSGDYWLTPDDVVNEIKKFDKNSIVLPISEYLRFLKPELFHETLKKLTEIEKKGLRIYMPLVGLWEKFEQEFWVKYHRKNEWAPIWKLDTKSEKINIYQLNCKLNLNNFNSDTYNLIHSTKEWFDLWKKDESKEIISFSKPLSIYYKFTLPDQTFYLNTISNPKEFLEIIFGIKVPIEYDQSEDKSWNKFVNEIININRNSISLKQIFQNHFNIGTIDNITNEQIIILFLKSNNDYDLWLIKNFVISFNKLENTYLWHCFKKLEGLKKEDLIEKLWNEIFNIPLDSVSNQIFEERKKLLKICTDNIKIYPNEDSLLLNLVKIKELSFKNQFKYLTDITITEKRFIFEIIDNDNIYSIIPELRSVYPDLYYYLNWDLIKPEKVSEDWIIEYLKEYNQSKVLHNKSTKLDYLIQNKNKSKSTFSEWFYSIPKIDFKEHNDCIWVDGLGAEWFPLIVNLINKYGEVNGKYVKEKMITRATLPSITKCNKYDFDKIGDLDKFIHNNKSYNYPKTLIEEIEIIKRIILEILKKPYSNIGIVSDHGFTFLCLKDFGNFKKLPFDKSEHEGRCMEIEKDLSDEEYYFVWDVDEGDCLEGKYLVASKHVSLNKTPFKEVHGGATPEEVLVPYILINTQTEKIDYTIEPNIFNNISKSDPKIKFRIIPSPHAVPEVFAYEKHLDLIYEEKTNNYVLNLHSLNPGEHILIVEIGIHSFKLNVDIKGGFKERDLI